MNNEFDFPMGEMFINNLLKGNSIAYTDNPDEDEIKEYFKAWKKAEILIYKRGRKLKIYHRNDYQ